MPNQPYMTAAERLQANRSAEHVPDTPKLRKSFPKTKITGVPPMKRPEPKFGFYALPNASKNAKAKVIPHGSQYDKEPATKMA